MQLAEPEPAVRAMEALRTLSQAEPSGMDREELSELLLKLSQVRVDLQQALDDLCDDQQGLQHENAQLHEAIRLAIASARDASDWPLASPRAAFGRLWEQRTRVSVPAIPTFTGRVAAAELGKQFAHQWQQLGQQVVSQFGGVSTSHETRTSSELEMSQDSFKSVERVVLDQVYVRVSRGPLSVDSQPSSKGWTFPGRPWQLGKRITGRFYDRFGQSAPADEPGPCLLVSKEPAARADLWQDAPKPEQVVLDRLYASISQAPQGGEPQFQGDTAKCTEARHIGSGSSYPEPCKKSCLAQTGAEALERIVSEHLYRSLWQRHSCAQLQAKVASAELDEAPAGAQGAEPPTRSAGWAAVSTPWQRLGLRVADRLHFRSAGCEAQQERVAPVEAPQTVERVVLNQLYMKISQTCTRYQDQPQGQVPSQTSGLRFLENALRSSGLAEQSTPRELGKQITEQWHQWGKQVNGQLSGCMAQGSLGWSALKPAWGAAEAGAGKGKGCRKAKRSRAPTEEEANNFSRVLLTLHVTLVDGSVATCDVRTTEQCSRAASRFVRRHSLAPRLRRPLRAYLRRALREATRLPARLEVDVREIDVLPE
mmetsp:Transcript_101640/g.282886  ORF Transcript_101640/g.282886 Transcript_101640/m.282886 type:complete len:595 (-) Transcript_101640:113-1897(-)